MTKKFIKASVLSLWVTLSACNVAQNSTEEKVIIAERQTSESVVKTPKISEVDIKNNLEYLASDALRGRETGTEGIDLAARYIEDKFKQANIKPYYQTYRDSFEVKGKYGFNLVGVLEGTDPQLKDEYIILGAHYDHIGLGKVVNGDSIANGANDNATGTVAVMELAKYFSENRSNKRSMMFILFSAEEMGLEGSKHIASKLKSAGLNLYAMVNFEMLGIPMRDKDYQAYLTGYEKSNMAERFNTYSGAKVLGFLPQAKEYNLFQRSDNYPFFQQFKVPAQTISTFDFTNYDYYHHVSDEAENMDYAHMAQVIGSVIPGLTKMANSAEMEIKME